MRKDVSSSIRVDNFDEVCLRLNAIVKTVEIEEMNNLLVRVIKLSYFEGSRSEKSLLSIYHFMHKNSFNLKLYFCLYICFVLLITLHQSELISNLSIDYKKLSYNVNDYVIRW